MNIPTDISSFRSLSELRQPRHLQFTRAAIVGLVAGVLAVVFQGALTAAEGLREEVIELLQQYGLMGGMAFVLLVSFCGGLAGWLTLKHAPETTGSGIPHIKAVLLNLRVLRWKRIIPIKFLGGVLAIGSGFSLGREGPTVQLGAAVGAMFSDFFAVPLKARAHLIACGGGAGLAAAFNAPLAGFIFVIEELRRELSPLTYGTALIAAVAADTVTRATIGVSPSFDIRDFPSPHISALPIVLLVGVVCGLGGILFVQGLLWFQRVVHTRLYVSRWFRALIVGLLVGVIGWFWNDTLGPGHHGIEELLRHTSVSPVQFYFLFELFVLEFVLTILCYVSGVPGGIFAPTLVHGAILGVAVGSLANLLFPSLQLDPSAFGVIGMAAYFGAVIRAPLTGVILIVEMTANYDLLFSLMAACVVSYAIAEKFGVMPIYDALLQYNLRRKVPSLSAAKEPLLYDAVVEAHSVMDGALLKDLKLPKGILLVTVKKGDLEIIPQGDTRLKAGYEMTFVLSGDVIDGARLIREASSMTRRLTTL